MGQGGVYTVVYIRFRAVMSESYELHNFPVDCQDLTFILESMDANKAVLCPRFKRNEFAAVDMEYFSLIGWKMKAPLVTIMNGNTSQGRSGRSTSRFFLQVKLKSRPQFYVSRIMSLAGM